MKTKPTTIVLLLLLLNVSMAVEETATTTSTNLFTPRASLVRYWNKEIRNDISKSPFLLSKASPSNAVESASFSKLASTKSLGTQLPDFCSSAKLFCFPDFKPSLEKHDGNSNFAGTDSLAEVKEHADRGSSFGIYDSPQAGYGIYDSPQAGYGIYDSPQTETASLAKVNEHADRVSSFGIYDSPQTGTASLAEVKEAAKKSGSSVNKWVVEPGKFFREKMLKKGTVMPMPDIRDKMPKRSFLPRTITSKMPFSSSKIGDIKGIFHAADDSAMEKIIKGTLGKCERSPSAGETKQCVVSAEDMIDFAISMLGRNIALRNTENTKGSMGNIRIGEVTKINGGMVTKSVSCHQNLYPYLLYHCHSVPKVRVYEADLLDANSKAKINHGVAICHLDTSSWSPTHGAFLSLESEPGKIEVCHWMSENDVTWTVAD